MEAKKFKLKKQIPNIILTLVFIMGLGIFLYPTISSLVNNWTQNRELSRYKNAVVALPTEKYEKLIEDARAYNKTLVGNNFKKNAENAKNTNCKNLLSLDAKGIIGYLTIDKINVKLPIYHGTGNLVLQVGLGHLDGSSLPVDGESVHCVISGHTGLPSAKLLTNLVELKEGDNFRINVLNERYTYKVDQILVVEPNETDAIDIVEGEQYVTILTCTPYGVNSHRLLVRGKLVNNISEFDVAEDATVIVDFNTIILIVSVIFMVIMFIVMVKIGKRRAHKERENDEKKDIGK